MDAMTTGSDSGLAPPIDPQEVMADLGAGRWAPLTIPAPLAPRRPRLGGAASVATVVGARLALAARLPLADDLLERLWFTPWTVGGARPRPTGAGAFDVATADGVLSGWSLGDGPTVMLVHGWGGRSTDLAGLAVRLVDAGMRVVAVDLPAHGSSPGTQTDLFEMAVAATMTGRAAGGLHAVVAHSLGSVATLLAMTGGLRVPKAVLLAPPATLGAAVDRMVRRARLGARGEAHLRARIEQRYGADVWDRLDVADTAAAIDADVLVVHDVDDREVPVGEGVRVARALGTEPVLTTDLGHGRILVDHRVSELVVDHVTSPRLSGGASPRLSGGASPRFNGGANPRQSPKPARAA